MRPHLYHPNFIEKIGNKYLVTLKNTGEVIDLASRQVIVSGLLGPHDGILRRGIYLLTESGRGVLKFAKNITSIEDLKTANFIDIDICPPNKGFVRGVDLLTDDVAIVAVSKRREIKDNQASWIALVDLEKCSIIKKIDIPLEYGTNPFSVVVNTI